MIHHPFPMIAYHTSDTLLSPGAEIVDKGLGDFNDAAAPLHEVLPILVLARNGAGAIVGGARGRTWGECAELQQLWVTEKSRGAGIGSELVRLYEARAAERGCRVFYLETFTFQAPSLYARLGYREAHAIAGFPQGIRKMLMTKRI